MSVEATGLLAAQARVAAIQGRFASVSRGAVTTSSGAVPSKAVPTSFDSALTAALAKASAPGSVSPFGAAPAGAAPAGAAPAGAAPVGAVPVPAVATGADGGAGDVGARAVAAARAYVGVPYVWGGTDPSQGLDCSGLVQRAFRDVGVELPRVAADQARAGAPVADLAQARPGDLVAFGRPVDHIGIYLGYGRMLVAPRAGEQVQIQTVYRTPSAIRRISPAEGSTAGTTLAGGTTWAGSVTAATATGVDSVGGAPGSGPFEALFARAGQRHGIPAALLRAVARTESGFDPGAVSPAGAVGLMQLMPGTAKGLGVDPRDPAQAVDGAARLLSQHLHRFGSLPLALAAYNAGPGAVERHGGVPPYAETQTYVRRVLAHLEGAS